MKAFVDLSATLHTLLEDATRSQGESPGAAQQLRIMRWSCRGQPLVGQQVQGDNFDRCTSYSQVKSGGSSFALCY